MRPNPSTKARQSQQGEDTRNCGREPVGDVADEVSDEEEHRQSDGDREPAVGEVREQQASERGCRQPQEQKEGDPEDDEAELHHPNCRKPRINLL
ncbi:hypothetical protein BRD08_02870 [Halobacteriales archaeon SW_10_66_29]|nr:MAG: hypothetical protein BRD08_02870 [Halobacteriales archaeon SW_10_66_29]